MKFAIDHVFPAIACGDFAALYFDEAFNEELSRALHMGRNLLRLDRTADRIVRHVRFEPARAADAAVNQAYGASRASFVEELVYDVRARRGEWRTIPNRFAERVKNTGSIEFTDADGGTRRAVRGEVKVSAFGFGGIVERMIVAEIEKNYAATTLFTRDYLARKTAI
ncbi:MAG TPA: DUF2505 family protein [Kofleriaceae bacterium]|nr:DUF2505 family protein [Kofleriaceae bacterium]